MTVDQFVSATGRTYRRARNLERHINELADVTEQEGFPEQAATLRAVAARSMLAAERYVDSMAGEVDL